VHRLGANARLLHTTYDYATAGPEVARGQLAALTHTFAATSQTVVTPPRTLKYTLASCKIAAPFHAPIGLSIALEAVKQTACQNLWPQIIVDLGISRTNMDSQ